MARFLVEQTFAAAEPVGVAGEPGWQIEFERLTEDGVNWVRSYVSIDRRRVLTLCDARDATAVRQAVARIGWPIDRITEVQVCDLLGGDERGTP